MRTYLTTAALAALACPLPAIPAAAQEATMAEALEYLQRAERPTYARALRILRQVDGRGDPAPRTSAELDAFADQVAAVAADATLPDRVRREANYALRSAASPEHDYDGTPYPRAFDLLVEVYEGGHDHALSVLVTTDSVRGMAYVRKLFERSERPPICRRGYYTPAPPPECEGYSFRLDARPKPFCKAGHYLFRGVAEKAWERTPGGKPWISPFHSPPVPEGMPEEVEDWYRRCL